MNNSLNIIFDIGVLDSNYIDSLLDDLDSLDLEYDYEDFIKYLKDFDCTSDSIANVIIWYLMNQINSSFDEELRDYTKEEFELSSFINCIDSHYIIYIDNTEYWIDDVMRAYIDDGIEAAVKELAEITELEFKK